jgi:hypothetical protein
MQIYSSFLFIKSHESSGREKMKKIIFKSGLALTLFLVLGCETIEHKTDVKQQYNSPFTVGIGDPIYSANIEKNLPNAFGKADIFGRTTPTGIINVFFTGIEDEKVILVRKDIGIETGATTMNSSAIILPNTQNTFYSGNVGGQSYYGSATTTGVSTVIPSNTPDPVIYDKYANKISIPIGSLPQKILVNNTEITILEATDYTAKVVLISDNEQVEQ